MTSERAERGIVYIDEIDKIARKSENPSITATCRAEAVQRRAEDPRGHDRQRAAPGRRKHPHQEFIQVDTSNVLFLCGGPRGTRQEHRVARGSSGMGFGAEIKSPYRTPRGRSAGHDSPRTCCATGSFRSSSDRLARHRDAARSRRRRAGADPQGAEERESSKQYQKYFDLEKVRLKFTDDAVACIAKEAAQARDPARGDCGRSWKR